MKFIEPSHFTDPDAAARKLVQIANAAEAVQDDRIFVDLINGPFLKEGGTPTNSAPPSPRRSRWAGWCGMPLGLT
jgi:hypothetical protein